MIEQHLSGRQGGKMAAFAEELATRLNNGECVPVATMSITYVMDMQNRLRDYHNILCNVTVATHNHNDVLKLAGFMFEKKPS